LTAYERTHWRDEALSERHRGYGLDAPMVDVDFLCLEYDTGKPVAIVEYKLGSPRPLDLEHSSYKAVRRLADASKIPFAVVFYNSTVWVYTAFPANHWATEWFREGEELTEVGYVKRLYRLRGREAPPEVIRRCYEITPERAREAEAAKAAGMEVLIWPKI